MTRTDISDLHIKGSIRSLSAQDKARIVAASLDAPHLARFAHGLGMVASTLSHWRSAARDGALPIDSATRDALRETMPQITPGARRRARGGARKTVSPLLAAELVLTSLRIKTGLDMLALQHGISPSYLTQLRARARDGMIDIPQSARDLLISQMERKTTKSRSPIRKPRKPRGLAAEGHLTPRMPAARKSCKPTIETTSRSIIVRLDNASIEVPSDLDTEQMRSALRAAFDTLSQSDVIRACSVPVTSR